MLKKNKIVYVGVKVTRKEQTPLYLTLSLLDTLKNITS